MRRVIFFLSFIFLFSFAFGQNYKVALSSAKESGTKILNQDRSGLTLQTSLNVLYFSTEETQGGNFVRMKIPGLIKTFDAGNPELPVYSNLVEIPQGATVSVEIVSYDEEIINLEDYGIKDKIYPAQPSLSKSVDPQDAPFYYNEAVYNKDEFFTGGEIATFEVRGTMRDARYGRVEIRPVQYNPVKNQLRILNNLVVKLTFENADWQKTFDLKKKYGNILFNNNGAFLNSKTFDLSSKELVQNLPITFVIVAPDMFRDSLQRFVAWKKLEGYNVIEAYTSEIGNTTTAIKSYLEDLYNNPPQGVNPPTFVLLVGDVAQIPAWDGQTEDHPTDLYYFDYTNDNIPDVYYGRWSAENANEIHGILQKTLYYEKFRMDPGYLHEVFLVAGDDESHEDTWGNGQINYGTTYYFNAEHNIYSHTFLQDPPMGNDGVHDSIIADISRGVAFANYTAHCSEDGWYSPSFSISDLSTLTNENKYGVWIGNCCLSNHFNYSSYDAFGEQALYIQNKGAVGYIGGSNSTYWDEDYWWGVGVGDIVANPTYESTGEGAYDGVFHDRANEVNDLSKWFITTSQVIRAGDLSVESSSSGLKLYYWEIYHLMGDPTLIPWIGTPQPLTLEFNPGVFYIGFTSIDVNGTPYTYIALTQDDELIGIGMTDGTGAATITFTRALSGSPLTIVARSQFHELYYQTIQPVAPDNAYLGVSSYTPTSADYGTDVNLTITVEDYNTDIGSDNNTATLTTDDEYVTITDDSEDLGDFNGGESKTFANAFAFSVADNVPDGHIAKFTVSITNGTDTWTTNLRITLNSPVLTSSCGSVSDAPSGLAFSSVPVTSVDFNSNYTYNVEVSEIGGNGNGRLDPGETVSMTFPLKNKGHAPVYTTNATLKADIPSVHIQNSPVAVGTVLGQETKEVTFIVSADDTISEGTPVNFTLIWGNDQFSDTMECSSSVGLIVEDFETGDFSAYNWTNGGDLPWVIDSTNAYEGNYCATVQDDLDNSESSYLEITLNNVPEGSELSFAYKVSSETNYDFLRFYVDGLEVNSWSGEVAWNTYTYTFTSGGNHTVKWEYEKDGSVSSGDDKAWLDFIVFPVQPALAKSGGKNILISAVKMPDWLTLTDNGDGTAKLTGTAPGEYSIDTVVLQASNGTYTTEQSFTITVGVTDIYTNDAHISFYPNPASDRLFVDFGGYTISDGALTITDMNGIVIKTVNLNGTDKYELNVSELNKGVYLLKINFDGNNVTNKVIIQ